MDKPPLPSPHDSPCQNPGLEGVSVSQGSEFKQLGQQEIDAYVRGEGGNRCFLNICGQGLQENLLLTETLSGGFPLLSW